MLNKPDICVSFETAKALHDAGIVVDSVYSWYNFYNKTSRTPKFAYKNLDLTENPGDNDWYDDRPYISIIAKYSAPTVAELKPILRRFLDEHVRPELGDEFSEYLSRIGLDLLLSDNMAEYLADEILKEAGYEIGKTNKRNARRCRDDAVEAG
uniref:Uncharacterized protein n=1 Tax=viral metagenome TaxID=1070528 RepID=A0A6M3IHA7_9ZZZZ